MDMLAARAPETIDFGQSSDETEEVDVTLDKLDAKDLRDKALAVQKKKAGKAKPEKTWSEEVISQYVEDLVICVNWAAEEGDMSFQWDCSALERSLIQTVSSRFKMTHGERMMVISGPDFIKVNWSGNYEV